MKEIAMTLDLKQDPAAIAAYKAYHASAWPEVTQSLMEVGILDMRIWLWGQRLFMLLWVEEGFEPKRDFGRYLTLHPRCEEWEQLMGTFQQALPGAPEGEKWMEMEKIFELRHQDKGRNLPFNPELIAARSSGWEAPEFEPRSEKDQSKSD